MTTAAKWLRLSAVQGNDGARRDLAQFYTVGAGVEKDSKKAIELYGLAAQTATGALRAEILRQKNALESSMTDVAQTPQAPQ
ncbi:MAG: hypothetical protein WDN06_12675 [Asticcacaulis sp.]